MVSFKVLETFVKGILFPFLFIVVMEALSKLTNKATLENLFEGFLINGRGLEERMVSHLPFADDALIFCGIGEDQLRHLWVVLCFEAVSGLKVNLGN